MLQAAGSGDQAGAKAAEGRLQKALDAWSKALRQQSGTATDSQLEATLNDLAGEVDGLGTKIETVDHGRLSAVQDRLDALCGGWPQPRALGASARLRGSCRNAATGDREIAGSYGPVWGGRPS
jgi:hypothetical protein